MASKNKNSKSPDNDAENPETAGDQAENASETEVEQAAGDTAEANEEPKPEAKGKRAAKADEPAPAAPAPTDLHRRLEKHVHGLLTSGRADVVGALHRAELAAGSLKAALPAAIEVADGDVKADLQRVLALL